MIAVLLGTSYYALVISEFALADPGACRRRCWCWRLVAVGDEHHARRQPRLVLAAPVDQPDARLHVRRARRQLLAVADPTQRLHHGNTNVVGFDADLELAPWARLAPSQPWHRRFRWQHVYIWPLYGFLSIKNLLVSDVATLIRRQIGEQPLRQPVSLHLVLGVAARQARHISAGRWSCRCMFNPWWAVLAFYARLLVAASDSCSRSSSNSRTASTSPRSPTPTRPAAATTSPSTSCAPPSTSPRRCRCRPRVPLGRRRSRSPDRAPPRARPAAHDLPASCQATARSVRPPRIRIPAPFRSVRSDLRSHEVVADDGPPAERVFGCRASLTTAGHCLPRVARPHEWSTSQTRRVGSAM